MAKRRAVMRRLPVPGYNGQVNTAAARENRKSPFCPSHGRTTARMRIYYTHQEARDYLGISAERLRQLAQEEKLVTLPLQSDSRIKIYRAKDIERLKFARRHTGTTDILAVLGAEAVPRLGEALANFLTYYLDARIALITIPATPFGAPLGRLPSAPTRRRKNVDVYRLKAMKTAEQGGSWLRESERLADWLTNLNEQYAKLILLVESNSAYTDLALLAAETVCLVAPTMQIPSVRALYDDVQARLLRANTFRQGEGARLRAVVLAGVARDSSTYPAWQRLRGMWPNLLVVREREAAVELVKELYGYKGKRHSPTKASLTRSQQKEGSEESPSDVRATAEPLPLANEIPAITELPDSTAHDLTTAAPRPIGERTDDPPFMEADHLRQVATGEGY